MKRTLIVYHSRSGHTRRVAQALAQRLDADLEELRIVQPMTGPIGYALCALEAMFGLTPALRPAHKDPADYALVLIGTPVWFWSLSSPVRSWLAGRRLPADRLGFFCTMGGSGAQRVFATMAQLAGHRPLATLALRADQVEAGAEARLDAFVRALHGTGRSPAAPARHPKRPARPAHAA